MMSDVFVSLWAQTDVGMQRAGNEDAFLIADLTSKNAGLSDAISRHKIGDRGSLLVVSDGMGGAAAGEIASEMAVSTLHELLESDLQDADDVDERLRRASEAANQRIWNHAQSNPELTGMGATLTAALVLDGSAHIAQVGDSRAYLVRGTQIKQLTKDQSLAQMLLDLGAIRPDQLNSVPPNVIMQALGTQPDVKVAMTSVRLSQDDCLLICSDGLSGKINPEEMRQAIEDSVDLSAACRAMVEAANQRGGEDNITVVVARFTGEGLDGNGAGRSITGSLRHIGPDFFAQKLIEVAMSPGSDATQPSEGPAQSGTAESATGETRLAEGVVSETISGHTNAGAEAEIEDPKSTTGDLQQPSEDDSEVITLRPPPSPAVQPDQADTAPLADEPSLQQQSEEALAPDDTVKTRRGLPRKSYALILIVALISLLLVGATGYFFYSLYLKPKPAPIDPQPPPSAAQRR